MNEAHSTPGLELPPDTVLAVRSVSKTFCRHLRRSMFYGAQDLALNLIGLPGRRAGALRKGEFRALENVSFDLKRGEGVGLIGLVGQQRVAGEVGPPEAHRAAA